MTQVRCATKVFEATDSITIRIDNRVFRGYRQAISQALLYQLVVSLVHKSCRHVDGAVGGAVVVVVNDERSLSVAAVGIGEDIFIDRSVLGPKIVEDEVGAVSEESAVLE